METDPLSSSYWNLTQEVENDGAGGKPQFHTLVGTPEVFEGLGWEIIAMTADDFARTGRFPIVIDNEMNIKQLTKENFPLFEAIMRGYHKALKLSNLVNITGETAVMRHSVTAFCDTGSEKQLILTWGASCIGLARRELLIDGSKIKPNMVIVGFRDPGYRCNGGTWFTSLILKKFGPDPKKVVANPEAVAFAKKLTTPSVSYARTICRLIGWRPDGLVTKPLANICGIAHITGGGVWGKFGELLPKGVGAILNLMPSPAEVMLEAQEMSWDTDIRLTDRMAYGNLHGACGALLVTDEDSAQTIIREAAMDGIEADVVGKTTYSDKNELIIHSRFKEEKILSSIRD